MEGDRWTRLWQLVVEIENDLASEDEIEQATRDAILHLTEALKSARSEKVRAHIRSSLELLDQSHQAIIDMQDRRVALRAALRPVMIDLVAFLGEWQREREQESREDSPQA